MLIDISCLKSFLEVLLENTCDLLYVTEGVQVLVLGYTKYKRLMYLFVSYMQMARSFVMKPSSTAWMVARSRVLQNKSSSGFLSSFARYSKPRVQAKILAIELVLVSWPF